MVRFGVISWVMICGLAVSNAGAESSLQPAPVDAFIPLHGAHADASAHAVPLLQTSAHFIPLTQKQMLNVHPRPEKESAAAMPAPIAVKSAHRSDMTDEEAKQILSLFGGDR